MAKITRGLALALSIALGPAACGGGGDASGGVHAARGVVEQVDAEAREVTIDHEDIPGFMRAMKMTFELAPGVSLDGIAEGVEVDFRVKLEEGVYTVTELRPTGP